LELLSEGPSLEKEKARREEGGSARPCQIGEQAHREVLPRPSSGMSSYDPSEKTNTRMKEGGNKGEILQAQSANILRHDSGNEETIFPPKGHGGKKKR